MTQKHEWSLTWKVRKVPESKEKNGERLLIVDETLQKEIMDRGAFQSRAVPDVRRGGGEIK